MKLAEQLAFPPPRTWGGRRAGSGRKATGQRPGVPHRPRPEHVARHPLHVTLRRRSGFPSLRARVTFAAVKAALARASTERFRVLHFSVQGDHVHLIVEAADRSVVSRGIQGLAVRVARSVNAILGRAGALFGDRYHARTLKTPREVRNAIAYVLNNWRKHISDTPRGGVDRCSSGAWFTGWREASAVSPPTASAPVAVPQTWLASIGWRRGGLIGIDETPRSARRQRR